MIVTILQARRLMLDGIIDVAKEQCYELLHKELSISPSQQLTCFQMLAALEEGRLSQWYNSAQVIVTNEDPEVRKRFETQFLSGVVKLKDDIKAARQRRA